MSTRTQHVKCLTADKIENMKSPTYRWHRRREWRSAAILCRARCQLQPVCQAGYEAQSSLEASLCCPALAAETDFLEHCGKQLDIHAYRTTDWTEHSFAAMHINRLDNCVTYNRERESESSSPTADTECLLLLDWYGAFPASLPRPKSSEICDSW